MSRRWLSSLQMSYRVFKVRYKLITCGCSQAVRQRFPKSSLREFDPRQPLYNYCEKFRYAFDPKWAEAALS